MTHALSLNDTFWVKPADSTVAWADVSLHHNEFNELISEDAFRRMCVLDELIFNPDRHYGNFGVLFDTGTMQPHGMAPVFDNNLSLFPQLDEEKLRQPEWYLEKCRPRLGRDFVLNAKGLLTPELRAELTNLRGF